MKRICRLMISLFILLFEGNTVIMPVTAEESTIPIYNVDELLNIADNPSGKYELMCDLDLSGVDWKPINFSGSLNGNGYSILNLAITSYSSETELLYDGNMKTYDGHYAGFFGIAKNAVIENINFVNEGIDISANEDIFVAGITGYMENTMIRNCSVHARLQVSADCSMFGIAGIAGFGYGTIDGCNADVELVSIDTNIEYKEEQFMGGILAAGYADITNCTVHIQGYDSDHGYVHDGGLCGMWQVYPDGNEHAGNLNNNTVAGVIHFFEDNIDRRAYCLPLVGEVMTWTISYDNFISDFLADETFDYSRNLLPEQDDAPVYTDEVIAPTDTSFGYTRHTCTICGYAFLDSYTLKSHQVSKWNVIEKATVTKMGAKQGICDLCKENVIETIPRMQITSIQFNKDRIVMRNGDSTRLEAYDQDGNLLNGIWSSNNTDVVSVDQIGTVRANHSGNAVITFQMPETDFKTSASIIVRNNLFYFVLILLIACIIMMVIQLLRIQKKMKRKKRRKI